MGAPITRLKALIYCLYPLCSPLVDVVFTVIKRIIDIVMHLTSEYHYIITDFRNIGHMPEGQWVGLLFIPESVTMHDILFQTWLKEDQRPSRLLIFNITVIDQLLAQMHAMVLQQRSKNKRGRGSLGGDIHEKKEDICGVFRLLIETNL